MAIITCSDCGHRFSNNRHKACPKCHPKSEKKAVKPATASELQFIEGAAKNGEKLTLDEARKQINKYGIIAAIFGVILFGGCVAMISSQDSYADGEYKEFNYVQARSMCSFIMKKKLRDPDSLRIEDVVITSSDGCLGTVSIKYRARNGFAGTNRSSAICEKYEDAAGTVRLKVNL